MRVTLEKLDGVDSAAVSLNEGRARILLRPGNALTLTRIRESVQRNGFTPQQAVITARADVTIGADALRLKISGTNDTYELAPTADADAIRQQLRAHGGTSVVIEGVVPVPKDPKATPRIQVTRVEPAARP